MQQPLDEIIHDIWRAVNMPTVTRQHSTAKSPTLAPMGDVLDSGVPAVSLNTSRVTAAIYGRNGVGKTTLACQGEGPIALVCVDPAPTGGARSVKHIEGVVVYQVAINPLPDPKTGKLEPYAGSQKMLAIADSLKRRFAAGQVPFKRVVVDGLTSWNEVILCEILRSNYDDMPAILNRGKVTTDQYVERSEKLIRYLRPFMALPCDVVVLAQERDHNPPKNEKGVTIGSKLLREAHPSALEGSFFSLALGDEQTRWVQNACDFVMQLYEDDEVREVVSPPQTLPDGSVLPGVVQQVPTGRRVRRLRCTYHPNYAARFREDYANVPEYIEAPTPAERWQAFLDVVAGQRTRFGKYNEV